MSALVYALIAALFFGLYNVLLKAGSSKLDAALGAFILQGVAALTGLAVLAGKYVGKQPLAPSQSWGIWLAIGAGISVGLAELLGFVAYRKGLPAAVGTPIMTGGGVALAVVLALLFLNESLNLKQAAGIALVVVGIVLLAKGH